MQKLLHYFFVIWFVLFGFVNIHAEEDGFDDAEIEQIENLNGPIVCRVDFINNILAKEILQKHNSFYVKKIKYVTLLQFLK